MAKASKPKQEPPKKILFNPAPELRPQLEYVAFEDRRTMTEILNEALADYLNKWEKKRGPIPEKYKGA